MSSRVLNPNNPEDALWVSCPDCDTLPGDKCLFDFDPDLSRPPGFDKAVHISRIRSMKQIAVELERETA
jgi:hypothetical protein